MRGSTKVRLALLGAGVSSITAALIAANRWRTTWGIDPTEAARVLPGDDLVPAPSHSETRGITIEAPPEAVWPWLVQMGYGRAGWYSYDQLDMKGSSAESIVPGWQSLHVGDLLPTHPAGGFDVRVVEEGRALAVYIDTAIVSAQAAAFAARPAAERPAAAPAGLQLSGSFMQTTPPEFAASWTFVLDPLEDGRTRLIERVRVWYGAGNVLSAVSGSAFGIGVFLMTRRQMLGIRRRAERHARDLAAGAAEVEATEAAPDEPPSEPPVGNGHGALEPAELGPALALS